MDFFCLSKSGIRVGFPAPRLLSSLSRRERKTVRGRVVLALTASHSYALHGVHVGTKLSSVAKRLHVVGPYVVGLNTWYLSPNGSSRGILKVRHNDIQEIGVANKALNKTAKARKRFLRGFY
jgi:hypothetical protein